MDGHLHAWGPSCHPQSNPTVPNPTLRPLDPTQPPRMTNTAVARASDDFYPRDPASSHPHVAACAYNSLFMGVLVRGGKGGRGVGGLLGGRAAAHGGQPWGSLMAHQGVSLGGRQPLAAAGGSRAQGGQPWRELVCTHRGAPSRGCQPVPGVRGQSGLVGARARRRGSQACPPHALSPVASASIFIFEFGELITWVFWPTPNSS